MDPIMAMARQTCFQACRFALYLVACLCLVQRDRAVAPDLAYPSLASRSYAIRFVLSLNNKKIKKYSTYTGQANGSLGSSIKPGKTMCCLNGGG